MIRYAQENVIRILVGNKADMSDKRRVTFEEGQELGMLSSIWNGLFIDLCQLNNTELLSLKPQLNLPRMWILRSRQSQRLLWKK